MDKNLVGIALGASLVAVWSAAPARVHAVFGAAPLASGPVEPAAAPHAPEPVASSAAVPRRYDDSWRARETGRLPRWRAGHSRVPGQRDDDR